MGSSDSRESKPWGGQIPYLKDVFAMSQDEAGKPLDFFPGSTVAPRTGGSIRGEQASLDRARGGYKTLRSGEEMLQRTFSGHYLDPESDPYLSSTADQLNRKYTEGIAPLKAMQAQKFAGAGRRQSDPGAIASDDRLNSRIIQGRGDMLNNLYSGNRARERGHMMQGAQMLPGVSQAFQTEVGGTYRAGAEASQFAQSQLDEAVNRFNFYQQEPSARVSQYSNIIQRQGAIPGTQTVNTGAGASGIGSVIAGVGSLMAAFAGMCHVAAEFYGWFTPDWFNARSWLLDGWQGAEAERFRSVYREHSESMAERVREDSGYAKAIRPLFDWAREMGSQMDGGE